ncbi:MAG: hypothetical protein UR81_C0021G0004 [Candidatus Levybacteria bacterium GW2011_GWB1_35_5]|nr:MAG: hypothetical protein UR81_C0021G0004 [Candidatus Levybacteria bacterium GW2011_GWB1_35_5]
MANISETVSRRQVLRTAAGTLGGVAGLAALRGLFPEAAAANVTKKDTLRWVDGKYQTYPRSVMAANPTIEGAILHEIDLGRLGPDVDTIAGIDFPGRLVTNAQVIHMPEGEVTETRVVFVMRRDLKSVQLTPALGGDRFDIYKISDHGGDDALRAILKRHAEASARKHQMVVLLGDLGLFERQWGQDEAPLLRAMIRAQSPSLEDFGVPGIPVPDFVNPNLEGFSKAGDKV